MAEDTPVKQWFVLHVLTSNEQKVQRYIKVQSRLQHLEDYIGEVVIPTERVSEVKNGVKTTVNRKFFPGYVLINLALYPGGDFKKPMSEVVWRFLKETPGVLGFIGKSENPMPMRQSEVDAVLNQTAGKAEKVKPKIEFNPGETVKINDGPFVGLVGSVVEVDPDRGRLKVEVVIFGRPTQVELEYWQVERFVDTAAQ